MKIHNLDSKEIFVNSKKGECVLNNLKANSIIVNSDCGNIECFNSLHGNIDFQTNKCGVSDLNIKWLKLYCFIDCFFFYS